MPVIYINNRAVNGASKYIYLTQKTIGAIYPSVGSGDALKHFTVNICSCQFSYPN